MLKQLGRFSAICFCFFASTCHLAAQEAMPDPSTPLVFGSSEGCQNASGVSGVFDETINIGGASRSYILVVPERFEHSAAHALIIAWHGRGMNSGWMRQLSGGVEKFAGNQALFVYAHAGKEFWDGSPGGPDVQFFDGIVSSLGKRFCLDFRRVFGTGFSNGAYFINNLAQYRPARLRAIAAVAGGGGGGVKVSALIVHGWNDKWVAFSEGERTQANWASSNGCLSKRVPTGVSYCGAYPDCAEGQAVTFCPWEGDHDWPEFAHETVWKFFDQFK